MDDIQTATKNDLLAYARDVLGLSTVNPTMRVDDIRAEIKLALGEATPPTESPIPDKNHPGNKSTWPVIIISPSDTDNRDVQVAVNGKQYLIQRGVEVPVPPSVLEVLKNAVQTVYPNPKTMEPVDKHSYPFTIVKQEG